MRETMDELGHTNVSVAVDSYQRVVREHHRDTVELLAYRYLPSDDPEAIRTVIAQKERQIGKPRDEVERLRKILLERDTGIPTDPDTVLPKNRNIEKPKPVKTGIKRNNPACPRPIGYRHTKNRRDGNNETGKYRKTGTSGPDRAPPTRLSVAPLIAATLRYRGNKHARLEMPIRIPKPVNTEIAEQGETDEREDPRTDGDMRIQDAFSGTRSRTRYGTCRW